MGARRIAGITVEIGGDTTKLTTALKDVDKALSTTQSSLRDVNKLLKLDPGNTQIPLLPTGRSPNRSMTPFSGRSSKLNRNSKI